MITAATTAFIIGADPTVWSNENFSDEYLSTLFTLLHVKSLAMKTYLS
jgi:hypothetical protein